MPGVAVPPLPIAQLAPVVVPAANAATQVLATPLLPNGTTATDVVLPVVLGAGAGIADAALPLETVNDTIITVLP